MIQIHYDQKTRAYSSVCTSSEEGAWEIWEEAGGVWVLEEGPHCLQSNFGSLDEAIREVITHT